MRLALPLLALLALATPARAQDPMAARTKGSASAPVTVYEMSDFQCPYCARFALEIFPTLDAEYIQTGKIRWIFVNFPLPMHPNATPAAEVAMCAAKQGKFWPVHDLLFRNQKTWAPLTAPAEYFLTFADSASLDRTAFQTVPQHRRDARGGEERRGGGGPLRREEHAELLYRGWDHGGGAAAHRLPADPGFGVRDQDGAGEVGLLSLRGGPAGPTKQSRPLIDLAPSPSP